VRERWLRLLYLPEIENLYTMIKTLIIDDEPSAVKTLSLILQHYVPEIKELKSTTDPHEALQLIRTFQPALVFLDIQMPLMNGFELLKQLPQINFTIIFTTAFDKYAIEAIRFSALDYLLKPIDADELRHAVDRFKSQQVMQLSRQPLYNNFLHNIDAKDQKDFKLALPTTEGTFFYFPDEIIRLEGESNYTRFYFVNKKPLLISKNLKEYEEILSDHGFIRVHKSNMINKKHLVNYTHDGWLVMTDQSRVEISRRRKKEVMEQLKVF
jgi:two-component system, LytTR family, response regulator